MKLKYINYNLTDVSLKVCTTTTWSWMAMYGILLLVFFSVLNYHNRSLFCFFFILLYFTYFGAQKLDTHQVCVINLFSNFQTSPIHTSTNIIKQNSPKNNFFVLNMVHLMRGQYYVNRSNIM